MTHTKQTAQKQPSSGMPLARRREGGSDPGTSAGGSGINPTAGGGSGSNPGASGKRPTKKSPAGGGKAPHINIIHGQRYAPYDQMMAAKLARENQRCR